MTTNDIIDFDTKGYIVFNPGLDDSLIERAVEFTRRDFGEIHSGRRQDAWKRCSAVKEIATHPAILSKLFELYGREAVPFQTLNFMVGTQQAIHSDTIHFNSDPQGLMCGVWVALEDVDEENGPLAYYEGSHRLPEVNMQTIGIDPVETNYPKYEGYIESMIEGLGISDMHRLGTIKRGEALIWAANLLHGGPQIIDDDRTRMSQVTHYFLRGADRYYTPMLSNPSEGKFFLRNLATLEIR